MQSIRKGISLLILFIFSLKSFAGTIKGIVADKESGEPLIGAVVMLEGTNFATATGLDGTYIFRNVPTGTYEVKVKYASYEDYSKKVSLTQDEVATINIGQQSKTSILNEVTVKGKYKVGSAEEARGLEKNSDNMMNVMSAKEIELLPDIIVSNVLQRVSGVQVERDANRQARYATIRGMDKRYNYTTIDGIKIPTTDDKGRYVPLDLFPAEILERVDVIKTLTPAMEGDAIGGVTNLALKKAPDHLVIYATAATGYNQNEFDRSFNSFDKSSIIGKDPIRYFGNNYSATPKDFPLGSSVVTSKQAPPNGLYSLSIGDRFLKDKLGVMFSGSYQNTYTISQDIFFKPGSQPSYDNQPELDDLDLRKYSTQQTRTALNANIDYRINALNKLTLGALYVQEDAWQQRDVIDSVITAVNRPAPGLGNVDYKNRTQFIQQKLQNIRLRGDHQLAPRLKLDWTVAYSKATKDMPDQTEFTTEAAFSKDPVTGNTDKSGPNLKSMTKAWEYTTDEDIQEFLNLTYSPTIFNKDVEFKVGAMDRNKNRTNFYNEYDFNPSSPVIPYGNVQGVAPSQLSLTNPLGTWNGNGLSYLEHENIWAYYLQGKARFFNDKLEAVAGVRVENTYVTDTAYLNPQYVAAVSGTYNYTNVLPSVNLKYKLSSNQNLRLSYFESITRPGYFELVHATTQGEDFDIAGNPNLVASTAHNIDARYEWFLKGIDQLFGGIFYKDISNPIEYVLRTPSGVSSLVIQPNNLANNAINYGVELQITKYFHYFGISGNYTYTHSAVKDTTIYLAHNPNGAAGEHEIFSTETRPLQGQAAHIGNLSLIYKNPTIGLDVQINEQYTGRHIYLLYNFQGLNYWQKATFSTSLSIEKRIVKHLSVYAKVNNLVNSPVIIEMDYSNKKLASSQSASAWLPFQNLKDGQTLVDKIQYGQTYLVGIRYKFD